MATRQTLSATCKQVRPIISTNFCEARRRALGLYKALNRYIPYIVKYYDIPKSEDQVRLKIREMFHKNARVTDIRIIDLLVMKGYMDLKEMTHNWKQKGHIMAYWNPTAERKPCSFIGKFLAGHD